MKTYKFVTGNTQCTTIHLTVGTRRVKVQIAPPVFYGNVGEAYYITSNEDIAQALMKHPGYGAVFSLANVTEDTPIAKTEVVEEKPEDLLTDAENAIYEESVTSKAKAVAYIQGMYDESFANTSSIEEMKKEAARRWNIIFVNWK